jgi:hypothetical protein
MLPNFPRWSYGLFLACAICLGLSLKAMQPFAQAEGEVATAARLASAGELDAAWTHWNRAQALGLVDASDRARFALGLYRGGDLQSASALLDEIGESRVDSSLAKELDVLVAQADEAYQDYRAGQMALLLGDDAKGWTSLEKAFTYYQRVKRPRMPTTRSEVAAELVPSLLEVGAPRAQFTRAEALAKNLDGRTHARERAVMEAWLAAHGHGQRVGPEVLGQVPPGEFQNPAWEVLLLEAQAKGPAARRPLGERARTLSESLEDEDWAQRAGDLADAIGAAAP